MRAIAILLLCASLGCASKTPAPPAPTPRTLDTQALAKGDAATILWALSQPHQALADSFGPHQLAISVESKLSKDKDPAVHLQEDILLSVDPSGAAHAQSDNNQNQGFDAYLTKTSAALATRYGPLQPAPRETVDRARDNALASVYANLAPLAPWLVFTPEGDKEISGVKGLRFSLDKKDAPAETHTGDKAWRSTIKPDLIAGEVVLDPKSGLLLFAEFSLRYTAVRSEQKITFDINVKANLKSTNDTPTIVVPEITPLEPKLRVEKERLDLIGKTALQQQKENKKKTPKYLPKPTTQTAQTLPAP